MWILLHSESMLSFIMPQTSSLWHRSSSFSSHFIDMAQAFATFAIPTVCVCAHTVHKYILWTELILVQFYISKGNTLWCDAKSRARTWPFHEKNVFSLNTEQKMCVNFEQKKKTHKTIPDIAVKTWALHKSNRSANVGKQENRFALNRVHGEKSKARKKSAHRETERRSKRKPWSTKTRL